MHFDGPDYMGGANTPSTRQCQQNFAGFGACDERCRSFVKPPSSEGIKDPDWKPLSALGDQPRTLRSHMVKRAFHLPGRLDED